MPKWKYSRRPDVRYKDKKKNYKKGKFGRVGKYSDWEMKLVRLHLLPDRFVAWLVGSSTNGIQALRWRIKNNYLGLYEGKGDDKTNYII